MDLQLDVVTTSTAIRESSNKRVVIQGHRGGFKPDNTLGTFTRSLESGLEAVELDVWLSKDGIPMVTHAGNDGELKDYGYPDDYVYEWTKDRLKTLDAGEGDTLPTLEEVFDLFRGYVFINIELKGPRTAEVKPKYDHQLAAETVYNLATKCNMHGKFLISSFSSEILKAAENARQLNEGLNPRFEIIYLYNSENVPLPSVDVYTTFGDGINISANHLTDEVIANCQRAGKKIGVWIRKQDFVENDDFYLQCFENGVDFICVDNPLQAMEMRKRYEKTTL